MVWGRPVPPPSLQPLAWDGENPGTEGQAAGTFSGSILGLCPEGGGGGSTRTLSAAPPPPRSV